MKRLVVNSDLEHDFSSMVAATLHSGADAQLWHTGAMSHPDFFDGALPMPASNVNPEQESVTPSGRKPTVVPRPMSKNEIRRTVAEFGTAAENAMDAGFDGVQIQANYLYLIAEYLNSLGTGTMTAVAYQLTSPFIILLAWPMLGDRPSLRTTFGVLLAFGGVLVAAAGTQGSTNVIAALLVACAALAFAVGNVLTKRYGPFAPLTLMAWMSLFTVPQVMLVSGILEQGQLSSLATADVRGWTMLTYTVVLSGIAGFGLWFWLIARCSIGRLAPFCLLQPVFAAASSVLFLGERLTAPLVVGGLISLVGVAVTQLKPKTRPGASRMQASAAADHLACSAHSAP
jgi:O-acetylserine/cysteine efflux transporter